MTSATTPAARCACGSVLDAPRPGSVSGCLACYLAEGAVNAVSTNRHGRLQFHGRVTPLPPPSHDR